MLKTGSNYNLELETRPNLRATKDEEVARPRAARRTDVM